MQRSDMIAIVDYNMGNLGSVMNAFIKVGSNATLLSDPDDLSKYDRVVLPGVGAFGDAMQHLNHSGMDQAIKEFAATGKPLMGTCLGMQLLFDDSQEFGSSQGLGLIPGSVVPFESSKFDTSLKVPHMGWNEMFIDADKNGALFANLPNDFYLYFVHSYHAQCEEKYITGKTHYGYSFPSAVQKDNIYGFQPHPEKSHNTGLKIIENFAKL